MSFFSANPFANGNTINNNRRLAANRRAASPSEENAGVDQAATYQEPSIFETPRPEQANMDAWALKAANQARFQARFGIVPVSAQRHMPPKVPGPAKMPVRAQRMLPAKIPVSLHPPARAYGRAAPAPTSLPSDASVAAAIHGTQSSAATRVTAARVTGPPPSKRQRVHKDSASGAPAHIAALPSGLGGVTPPLPPSPKDEATIPVLLLAAAEAVDLAMVKYRNAAVPVASDRVVFVGRGERIVGVLRLRGAGVRAKEAVKVGRDGFVGVVRLVGSAGSGLRAAGKRKRGAAE
ncbi:hypothetical protein BCR44DRAFT_58927 [Catenaria anguillulae PL171]|uniref:Uncharacterized protein n=1 Tax=Catenaria anguillulae PL171 TaxID=765915 RepID=A0A1Y2H5A1_9FUNG|nr:hypothetical protein BCR44DRAFT_58927 [Catenaria anguillulae PL171]